MVSWFPMGRAGNFFFQAATAWAYAKKHGLEFSVAKTPTHPFHNPIYLHHLQNPNYNPNLPATRIIEKNFHYDELPFYESWRNQNIILQGYFQSWRYFDEYREEMLDAFNLPHQIKHEVSAIHGRFGDYLTIPGKHILLDEQYLVEAMNFIKTKTGIEKFRVFSDDIQYFKDRFGYIYNFEYSATGDIMQDLIEMSWCHSNINSSSTYAWWGAYLNRNPAKVVITQREWFRPGWDNADTKDIIPKDWIKI